MTGSRAASLTGPDPTAVDQATMRAHNLGLTLRFVRDHQPCSRAAVAAGTGLTKPAVTKVVGDLLRRRLVEEVGSAHDRGPGRPSTLLTLARARTAVGVELRVDHIGVLVRDLAGTPLAQLRSELPRRPTPAATVRRMSGLIGRALRAAGRDTADGLAVAMPALLDPDRDVALGAPWLGWESVQFRRLLGAQLGERCGPLQLDSVANLAALATSRAVELPQGGHLVHIEIGAGAGLGRVVGGVLQRGAHGHAGAIGHLPMLPDGPPCACGRRGCLDALVGFEAFVRAVEGPGGAAPEADYSAYARAAAARAAAGDRPVQTAIEELGRWVGRAAAITVNLLDPDALTVGGYLVHLRPWIIDAIRAEVAEHARALGPVEPTVVSSPLGDAAPLVGSATLATEHIFADPTLTGAQR